MIETKEIEHIPLVRKRIIGKYNGNLPGPTLIFVGGIHGNEPSGVLALEKVLSKLNAEAITFNGKMIALSGNLKALEKHVRFLDTDLNRQFTSEKIEALKQLTTFSNSEQEEQIQLLNEIEHLLANETGPFYFFDLHTTSSKTIPFLTVNDSLLNRTFTKQYPLPIVLGIEEYLEGPLLSYINELGYVAFGFEGGQHDCPKALLNHEAFIWITLGYTDCIEKTNLHFINSLQRLSQTVSNKHTFYEIIYRHFIKDQSGFEMGLGYVNFQHIKKHERLAKDHTQELLSPKSGQIFMPLYQGKGNDGFFIIRKIPKLFLGLSKLLRNVNLDELLVWLPGISWGDSQKTTLKINRKVARFFAKDFFHLLGYRSKSLDRSHYLMKNREALSRDKEYEKEVWYR